MRIQISKPFFDSCEKELVNNVIDSGWITQGEKTKDFEKLFKDFTGAKNAIAVSSGTAALHLSLLALGIKRGDKVIVPSFSFVATANVVENVGAEIIFCDINLDTFNLNVNELNKILEAEKKGIKAVIPVHEFGLCADMISILKLKDYYGFYIIEDAACALGSYIGNAHAGTFGDIGCFSFHPRKVITTGEGGMIITNNIYIAEKLFSLRNHGLSKNINAFSLLPEVSYPGFNYRITDIQSAIGLCQMKKLNSILEKRKFLANLYFEGLEEIDFLKLPHIPRGYTHSFQSFVVLYTEGKDIDLIKKNERLMEKLIKNRNRFIEFLGKNGIEAKPGGYALPYLSYYKNKYHINNLINSYIAENLSVALPIFPGLSNENLYKILYTIRKWKNYI